MTTIRALCGASKLVVALLLYMVYAHQSAFNKERQDLPSQY